MRQTFLTSVYKPIQSQELLFDFGMLFLIISQNMLVCRINVSGIFFMCV